MGRTIGSLGSYNVINVTSAAGRDLEVVTLSNVTNIATQTMSVWKYYCAVAACVPGSLGGGGGKGHNLAVCNTINDSSVRLSVFITPR